MHSFIAANPPEQQLGISTMRGRIATAAAVSIVLFMTLVYIFTPKSTYPTHIAGGYPYVKPKTPQIHAPEPNGPAATPAAQKLIVKVQLEGEDLNWLVHLLPEWHNQIITIDTSFAHLHAGAARVDKGRIAAAYLSWLITNYANLAETIVFVPPHADPQHADPTASQLPAENLVSSIQALQVPHIQSAGFAPLFCPQTDACEDAILPFRTPPDEFRTLEVKMAKAWEGLFNDTNVPEKLASPGGSAFAVSRAQVLRRSVREWKRYWEWLATTKMDDDSAGAVVERLWHVMFGREGVWCPGKGCGCEVFGRC